MSESDPVSVEINHIPEGTVPSTSLPYGSNALHVTGYTELDQDHGDEFILEDIRAESGAETPIVEGEIEVTEETIAEDRTIDEIIKRVVIGNSSLPEWLQKDTALTHGVIGMVRSWRKAAKEVGVKLTDQEIYDTYYKTWKSRVEADEAEKATNPDVEIGRSLSEVLAEQTLFLGSLLVDPKNPDSKLPF